MGTRFELAIARGDAPVETWDAIGEAALEVVTEWHDRLNRFDRRSLVGRINASAVGTRVPIDADLAALLALCGRVGVESHGAFDPCAGGSLALDPRGMTITRLDDKASLDFGAIAKGFALDLAASELREQGVTSAILHGGTSTVVAIGAPPDAEAWVIEVPGIDGESGARVALQDEALSVSRCDDASPQPGHVIDPRSGVRASGALCAAVVAQSAAITDAWATALLVLGSRPAALAGDITTIIQTTTRAWRTEGSGVARVTLLETETAST